MSGMMQRRLFLQALAASVVAVGAPLPVGFPTEWRKLENVVATSTHFDMSPYDLYRWQVLFLREVTTPTVFFT